MSLVVSTKALLALLGVPVAACLAYYFLSLRNRKSVTQAALAPKIQLRQPEPGRKAKVTQLVIYPLKSCKGISVERAELGPYGFKYDRQWMIVTQKEKRFITQRQVSKLALIEQKIENGNLILTGPNMPSPLVLPLEAPTGLAEVTVTIWKDTLIAFDEGEAAAKWITEYLRDTSRADGALIVRLDPKKHSRVLSEDSWAVEGARNESAFSDGYPILLMNTTSLEELNKRVMETTTPSSSSLVSSPLPSTTSTTSLDSAAPMSASSVSCVSGDEKPKEPLRANRFRPNLIVTAPTAFEEDEWMTFRIGKNEFDVVKPCDRCKVTTIHQESGTEQGPEPLRTLGTFRSGKDNRLFFCENVIHKNYSGFVSVGDDIEIVSLRAERHELWKKTEKKTN